MHIQEIRETIGPQPSWEVDFFSFAQFPTVTKDDLKAVGIKSHIDVGEWIVSTLANKLDQEELAGNLQHFFNPTESPCLSQ